MFVVGEMSQLADYVYRDYHVRMQALNTSYQHTQVMEGGMGNSHSNSELTDFHPYDTV